MTDSPKPPARPAPRAASTPDAAKAPLGAADALARESKPSGPPPPPQRHGSKAAAPQAGAGTAPSPPAVVLPPAPPTTGRHELTREEPRDTLAPSSFGTLGSRPNAAPAPTGMRTARAPMPTLGELEGASATATLRPPGAVPPPPRALPMATPNPDASSFERTSAYETPLPAAPAFAGNTLLSGSAAKPAELESTLDMSGSASKKAAQAALVEQTRSEDVGAVKAPLPVPAPGLFIADEPLEPRPKQASLVTVRRKELSRLRAGMLVLGSLLLMAAGALMVMIFRRAEGGANRQAAVSASAAPTPPPGCALLAPPSRLSPIERSVPISALALADGNVALAIADTKTSAVGFLYRPQTGDAERRASSPSAEGEVTHVTAGEPPIVDRASPDFSFAQTLSPGLELGVGPSGIVRRGSDGATGVVWPLPAGARVTPPRVASLPSGHFVTFREGGAEGRILSGWLRPDGSAATQLTALEGVPKNLGTPSAAMLAERALLLFSAREGKSERYRVFAATVAPGHVAGPPRALDTPSEGGGAIAPSLAALPGQRYLLQWTDGTVGQYQVHARVFDAELAPLGPPLLLSAKGANAGQGSVVSTTRAAVSFFIQTTAGHDELWGVALSCH